MSLLQSRCVGTIVDLGQQVILFHHLAFSEQYMHQLAGDDDDMHTAILIVPPGVDTDDRPMIINLRDTCAPGRYERVLEVVAADPAERDGSRVRWSEYKRLGFELAKFDM